jgi:hypothetical protein
MFTIFGSGFGLYGYLPAIIYGLKESVCLPEVYLDTIRNRSDLRELEDKIIWVEDEATAISLANKVVISVNPSAQIKVVQKCLDLSFSGCFFLEKPLAHSPKEAKSLLHLLDKHEVDYFIGYSFLYLEGLQNILKNRALENTIQIEWKFMAYHFSNDLNNWKRCTSEGGGVLRFYGIHIVALLTALGYSQVVNSKLVGDKLGEPSLWEAEFSHSEAENCRIIVDSRSEDTCFIVKSGSEVVLTLADPFDLNDLPVLGVDRRFSSLVHFLRDVKGLTSKFFLYRSINQMWSLIEKNTISSLFIRLSNQGQES